MNPSPTAAARDEGMAKADRGVSNAWRSQAAYAILHVAELFEAFSSDDVRCLMVQRGQAPRNWCALGPALTRAERAGWIKRCGLRGLSAFASTHSAESKMWTRSEGRP